MGRPLGLDHRVVHKLANMMSKSRSLIGPTVLLAAIISAGCAKNQNPTVTGSVTYNGQPVESGYVSFSPTASGTSVGAKIVDGKYTAEKAHPGQFRVLVQATSGTPAPKTRVEAEKRAASRAAARPNYIPENAEGNGQTVEIKAGEQTIDIALKGPPRQSQ
jgi:hypothetical protein